MKKNILLIIIGVVIISSFLNIKNQFNTLKSANLKNDELKLKLEQMNILKNNLIKKIEYATTSAFVDSQRKELLGLGTDNDYWLDITSENTKTEIIREVHETNRETNSEKWIKLFTD